MFAILNVLLMAPGGGAGGAGGAQGGSGSFLPLIILMVGIFFQFYHRKNVKKHINKC
jgi:hypothetical protein